MSAAVAPYHNSSQGNPPSRPPTANGGGERVFAHIRDLKADALTDFNPGQSIVQLYDRAERALGQAKTYIDFRRPDLAFVE